MRVTGGASAPHPSSSTGALETAGSLRAAGGGATPPDRLAVNTGFVATGGLTASRGAGASVAEYLAPEASETF